MSLDSGFLKYLSIYNWSIRVFKVEESCNMERPKKTEVVEVFITDDPNFDDQILKSEPGKEIRKGNGNS